MKNCPNKAVLRQVRDCYISENDRLIKQENSSFLMHIWAMTKRKFNLNKKYQRYCYALCHFRTVESILKNKYKSEISLEMIEKEPLHNLNVKRLRLSRH